jgi:hypothetical protein
MNNGGETFPAFSLERLMNKNFPLHSIANFGQTPIDMGTPAPNPTPHQSKAKSVESKSLLKRALLGSPEDQRLIATAYLEGNELGQDPDIRSIFEDDSLSFSMKHGAAADRARGEINGQLQQIRELKEKERTGGEVLQDSALAVGNALARTVGAFGQLGATAIDQAFLTSVSPTVAEFGQDVTDYLRGNQTELLQDRREQAAYARQLDEQDNAALRDAEIAAGTSEDWADTKKVLRDFGDGLANTASDPMLLGDLGTEAVGSLIGAGGAIKIAARLFGSRSATAVIAAIETGAASGEVQNAVLNMPEERLEESPVYQNYLAQGLSKEQAREKLSIDAAQFAALAAVPGALAAGKLSSKFAANPLARATSPTSVGRNIASETAEETLQETNASVVGNLADQEVLGLETDLTEGVGYSASQGALGGFLSAAGMQTPGATAAAARSAGSATANAMKTKWDNLGEELEETIENENVVGAPAQQENKEALTQTVTKLDEKLTAVLPEPATGDPEVRGKLTDALYLTQEELTANPGLEPDANGKVSRVDAIVAADKAIDPENGDRTQNLLLSLGVLMDYNQMRALRSDETIDAVTKLNDADATTELNNLQDQLNKLESLTVLDRAKDLIRSMTSEEAGQFVNSAIFSDPSVSPEEKAASAQLAAAIAQVNPEALSDDSYKVILNQRKGKTDKITRLLEASQVLAKAFKNSDQEKAQIRQNKEAEILKLSKTAQRRIRDREQTTPDLVRDDILTEGNRQSDSNKLLSITGHREQILDAISAGRYKEASDALGELKNFALSMVNKAEAVNKAADTGGYNKERGVTFKAYGPYRKFFAQEPAWVNTRVPTSVAFAQEVHVDAQTVTDAYNVLSKQFEEELGTGGEQLSKPAISSRIALAPRAALVSEKETVAPAPERRIRKDARNNASESLIDRQDPIMEDSPDVPIPSQTDIEETLDVSTQEENQEAETSQEAAVEDRSEPEIGEESEPEVTETRDAGASDTGGNQAVEGDTKGTVVDDRLETAASSWFTALKEKLAIATNFFVEAYAPTKGKSSFGAYGSPAQYILENLGSLSNNSNNLNRELTEAERTEVREQLEKGLPAFAEAFQKKAFGAAKQKKWFSRKDNSFMFFEEAASLNFATKFDESGVEFDPLVLEATFMAATEWLLTNALHRKPVTDREKVSKALGKGRYGRVTDAEVAHFRKGPRSFVAIDEISRKIEDLLGVKGLGNVSSTRAQGITKSLASNALSILTDQGHIKPHTMMIAGKKHKVIEIQKTPGLDASAQAMRLMPDVYSRTFLKDGEVSRYIGEPPKSIKTRKTRSKNNQISAAETRALKNQQEQAYYVNSPLLSLVQAIGKDNYTRLLGAKDVLPTMNANDRLSVEGKNQSLERAYVESLNHIEAVQQMAESLGKPVEEVASYFQWEISSVGRMQQQGKLTPQGDKTLRELLSATWSTLDLSQNEDGTYANPAHHDAFWIAVAQSIGVKVEKQSFEKSIADAKNKMFGDLGEAVTALESWFRDGELDSDALSQVLASEEDITPKLLHAVLAVAQLQQATDAGTLDQFKTALAIEADGVTDGPINALIHMGRGNFTPQEIANYAKGGLFFTSQSMSMSEFIEVYEQVSGKRHEDLYTLAAKLFEARLIQGIDKASNDKISVLDFLNTLSPNLTLGIKDDRIDSVEIGRNMVKNPLTVFLYGAAEDGITNKVINEALDSLWLMLSEYAKTKDQNIHQFFVSKGLEDFTQTLRNLFGEDAVRRMSGDPSSFSLTDGEFKKASSVVKLNFTAPMVAAIDEVTEGMASEMKLMQKISNVQTAVFKAKLEEGIQARLKERRNSGNLRPTEFLSQNDMDDVFREASRYAPIYSTDEQEFWISEQYAEPATDRTSSASFDKQYSAGLVGVGAQDASVKVSPYLTIGTGDGRMILNIYSDGEVEVVNSLPVFDGVELAAGSVREHSRVVNQSVFNAWQASNGYQAVLDSYSNLIEQLGIEEVARLAMRDKDLQDREFRTQFGNMSHSMVRDMLLDDLDRLATNADSQTARKAVMGRINTQTDHMAAAAAPAANGSESTASDNPFDFAEIAAHMNMMLKEEEGKLLQEKQASARRGVQKPTKALQKFVDTQGQSVEGHPQVRKLQSNLLTRYLLTDPDTSKDQKKVLRDLLRFENTNTATVYFGSEAELNAFRAKAYPETMTEELQHGMYASSDGGVVFVVNTAPETVLHELLHNQTSRILTSYYRDPQKAPVAVRDAVRRLERLAGRTLKIIENNEALAHLHWELNRKIEGTDREVADIRAAKMGEFISWMLSNQEIIERAKKRKFYVPLAELIQKGLKALKELLGIKGSHGDNVFSNVLFDTNILVRSQHQMKDLEHEGDVYTILNQRYPQNARLQRIEQVFGPQLMKYMNNLTKGVVSGQTAKKALDHVTELTDKSNQAAEDAVFYGFALNPREGQIFRSVYQVLLSNIRLRTGKVKQLYDVYDQVMERLDPKAVLKAWGNTNPSQQDIDDTGRMLDYLVLDTKTKEGKSDAVARFMALAMVNEDFRKALETIPPEKATELKIDSIDNLVNSAAQSATNALTRMSFRNPSQGSSTLAEIDALMNGLIDVSTQQNNLAMTAVSDKLDEANDYLSGMLEKGTKKATNWLAQKRQNATSAHAKGAYAVGELLASVGSREYSAASGDFFTSLLNKTSNLSELRSTLSDLRGMTAENASLLRMLNKVRTHIAQIRQQYRETLPAVLANSFSKPLGKEVWSQMYRGIAETDLLVLGRGKALALLENPDLLEGEIAATEQAIAAKMPQNISQRYMKKSEALAEWMMHRKATSNHLLRNAYAISILAGSGMSKKNLERAERTNVKADIDKLITLYAFSKVDDVTKETVKRLYQDEFEGLQHVVGTVFMARKLEQERINRYSDDDNQTALINGWKGFVPAVNQAEGSVVVRDDRDNVELRKQGYVRVGDYIGDRNEEYAGSRGYYQRTISSRSTFNQGIAQTVHKTWNGVDARTGQTRSTDTAGLIIGKKAERLAKDIRERGYRDDLTAGEYLLPIIHGNEVVGYERAMDPEKMAALRKDTHLGRMLGVWVGRVAEEGAADVYNSELIQTLKDTYDKHKDTKKGQFVNIADPNLKDEVIKDAWDVLGADVKAEASRFFGQAKFVPVLRDQVNDAIGYHTAGVRDMWSGVSRWSPENQKRFRETMLRIMGPKALVHLAKAEGILGDVVSYARTSIVVRSMVVMAANLTSNALHLASLGINPVVIAQKMREKFIEVTEYTRNREKLTELETQLAAAFSDPAKQQRIITRMQALRDANARLSIAPLIEAGEFSTIAENLTEADLAIRDGKIADFMEKATNKLPSWAGSVAKNAAVTKDTALFQGINRMVQYGDFVAKAVLHEHLIEKKGKTAQEAMDQVFEEFVPYNRLGGRWRGSLENMGLLWFMSYKLRIMKIALQTLRERPLTGLMVMGGVGPATGADTVWSGSLLGAAVDDGLGYSVGPEMGLQAFSMNPWWNLTGN